MAEQDNGYAARSREFKDKEELGHGVLARASEKL